MRLAWSRCLLATQDPEELVELGESKGLRGFEISEELGELDDLEIIGQSPSPKELDKLENTGVL